MGYGGAILIPRSPHGEPNTIRVIKSRRMRWAGHVARVGEKRIYVKFWSGHIKGRGHSEYLDLVERIILEWILRK